MPRYKARQTNAYTLAQAEAHLATVKRNLKDVEETLTRVTRQQEALRAEATELNERIAALQEEAAALAG